MPAGSTPKFVFLLKFNSTDVTDIANKFTTDQQHWAGDKCTFLPVTGQYDVVALAAGGTETDALNYALYLTKTGRYRTTTLNVFSLAEFSAAAIPKGEDPKKR